MSENENEIIKRIHRRVRELELELDSLVSRQVLLLEKKKALERALKLAGENP